MYKYILFIIVLNCVHSQFYNFPTNIIQRNLPQLPQQQYNRPCFPPFCSNVPQYQQPNYQPSIYYPQQFQNPQIPFQPINYRPPFFNTPTFQTTNNIPQFPFTTTRYPQFRSTSRQPNTFRQFEGIERISVTKCKEYAKLSKNSVTFVGLSMSSSKQNVETDDCELSTGLVLGGKDSRIGEFPHQAAIGYRNELDNQTIEFRCGGSLISDRFVLTATHCKITNRVKPTIVRLGDLTLSKIDLGLPEIDIPISQFIPHEKYNSASKSNDIALVKLSISVAFSKFLRPACLAQPNTRIGTKAIATGWGFTEARQISDILQKVELKIYNPNVCHGIFNPSENNVPEDTTLLCAGDMNNGESIGKDTCEGDSGGPLQIIRENNRCTYTIIGITSYGSSACGIAPGFYTKVSSYLDWIEEKVWQSDIGVFQS